MNILETIKQRKSVRAFLKKDVEKEKIKTILETAKHAPSGVNMQPWQVVVVSGETKKTIETQMIEAFKNKEPERMGYNYYPLKWEEPYKSRRKETGMLMYSTLDIKKEDKEKQFNQWLQNYTAFDAPVVLYFFIDEYLEIGSYLDYGMFLQSIMLTAVELGLGTCTQAALAQYPDIVKKELHIEDNKILLCGIALGYEDKEAIINSYRTPRIALDDFVTFHQ
jgi:nitroreductase